jgi:uncharacterized membrane protein
MAVRKVEKPNKETFDKWHSDPSNWKLGIFYYNKKDQRIFPPKRFKSFGWTVNFANPYSCLVFMAIIVLGIVTIKYYKNY